MRGADDYQGAEPAHYRYALPAPSSTPPGHTSGLVQFFVTREASSRATRAPRSLRPTRERCDCWPARSVGALGLDWEADLVLNQEADLGLDLT